MSTDSLERHLERFVRRAGVPAAGAAVFDRDGQFDAAVVGTLRRDQPEQATVAQQWHIGSCAKSLTAAAYALLVQRGRAKWGTPVIDLVPDLADDMDPRWATPTVDEVLQCRAGVRPNLTYRQMRLAWNDTRPPSEQRTSAVREALRDAPARHGRFVYSNLGYVLVGAAIDRLVGSYEDALRDLLFDPLGITSAGFGPPPDIWGHGPRLQLASLCIGRGRPAPPDRPASDNPGVYTPAGRLHFTLADWATIQRHLYLDTDDCLLAPDSIERLLHLPDDGGMAMGWASAQWIPGASYGMQGSNARWAATALLDDGRERGVLLVANDGRTRTLRRSIRAAGQLLPSGVVR